MNNTKKTTIHGIEVTQVNYSGKWYTPVAGRVQIAERADPKTIRQPGCGYHVVSVQIIQIGDQWAYHCMVEYPIGSGVMRPGTDFIDLNDKKSGIAKAETSAIGRALGLHGIASEESISSADEMSRVGHASGAEMMEEDERQPATTANRFGVWQTQPPTIVAPKQHAKPAQQQKDEPANAHAQQDLLRQLKEHGYTTSAPAEQFLVTVVGHGVSISQLKAGTSSITMREVGVVLEKLGGRAEDSAVEEVEA